jgi:glutaredoxin
MKPGQISIVLATWCPHCVPLSVEMVKKMSAELGAPYRVLDIDVPADTKLADDMVKEYGDDAEDYLVPQVFLEFPNENIQHIFTGFSESTEVTRKHWEDLFSSKFYAGLFA